MSLKDEIEIDYMKRKTKVNLPKKYSEFLELCKKTFYISEERSGLMSFVYFDNEGYENLIDEDEYNKEESRKVECWKLIIDEDEEEEGEKDINSSISKEELIKTKNEIIEKAKSYKEKLYQQSMKIVESKIKERNKQHKENIKKIQDEYKNGLEEIKKLIGISNDKSKLEDISNNVLEVYKNSVDSMNEGMHLGLKDSLNSFKANYEKKLDEIKINEIVNLLDKMQKCITNCMNSLTKK